MAQRAKPETWDPIPEQYAKHDWAQVQIIAAEGAEWRPVLAGEFQSPGSYHAIQYANGWIFDYGLREQGLIPWRHVDGDEIPDEVTDDGT